MRESLSARVLFLKSMLNRYQQQMRIVYAFFSHPGNQVVCSRDGVELQAFFDELNETDRELEINVLCANSTEEFMTRLLSLVALQDRTAVLAY